MLRNMRAQSAGLEGDQLVKGLLDQAEALHSAHKAKPARPPFLRLAMPTIQEEKEAPMQEDPDPHGMAGKRTREEATPADVRAKRSRLLGDVEEQMAQVRQAATHAMAAAKTQPLKIIKINAPTVVQNLLTQFNQDENVDIQSFVSSMEVQEQDRSKVNEIANYVERVQEGLKEADASNAERQAKIADMPADKKIEVLKEDGLDARLALYEAKKRAEMLRFRAELDADPETMKQVEAQIAKDNARLTKELKSIDKQISESGGMASGYDDSWNMSEERVNELRARNAKYLQMAVRQTEEVVRQVNIEPVVAAQIVSERTEMIKQAARKDRVAKELPKEKVGKETKKLISPKATANFGKALKFVQKAWWEVNPNYLSSSELGTIQKESQKQGLTIHNMVNKQANRVKQKMTTKLTGKGLKKYSLTANSASNVEATVANAPFSGVTFAKLDQIKASYKAIYDNATPVEKSTPEYRVAGKFISMIDGEIEKQELQRSAPSLVQSRSVSRERVPVSSRGRGLSKKPKKRAKRSKKKGKKQKKSPKPVQKAEPQRQTALQKWDQHTRLVKKMRL
jgi:hypothetical protein